MADETITKDEKPIDTSSPDIINPMLAALGGRSMEEFIASGGKEAEPIKVEPAKQEPVQPDATQTAPPVTGSVYDTEPKPEPPPSDEEIAKLLEMDPATLKTKAGTPVSEASRKQFKTIQSALKAKDEKLKAAIKQMEELKAVPAPQPLEEQEPYKAVLTEKEKLKQELDLVNFENSDVWKATFLDPIVKQTGEITKILKSIKVPKDDHEEMVGYIRQAEALLGDTENLVEFNNLVDKISEDYMKPTTANAFSRAMTALFDLSHQRAEAYADKGKARDRIVEEMAKKSTGVTKTLQDRLDAELIAFEKTDVGQIFKKNPDWDLETSSKVNRQKALSAIRDLQVTGQVTGDMAEMMRSYALKPAMEKEREFLVTNYIKLGKAVEELLKEKDELQKRIIELRGEGQPAQAVPTGGNGAATGWDVRSIFGAEGMQILDKMGLGR